MLPYRSVQDSSAVYKMFKPSKPCTKVLRASILYMASRNPAPFAINGTWRTNKYTWRNSHEENRFSYWSSSNEWMQCMHFSIEIIWLYSEAIQYIVENQTRMQDYDSLKQKANTISIHSWLTTPFLHVIKAEKTGRGINFRFEKDFLPTFFVIWTMNFHFIKCRCVQFGYFIDNKEGISITVKNYR